MQAWLKTAAVLFLCVAWGVVAVLLWPTMRRVDKASSALLDCTVYDQAAGKWRGNPGCIQSNILAFTGSVKQVERTTLKVLPDIAQSAKLAAQNSAEASKHTAEAARKAGELLDASTATVQNVNGAITQFRGYAQELHDAIAESGPAVTLLLNDSDATIQSAGQALDQVTKLEAALTVAIDTDNQDVKAILQAMLDRMNDPALTTTLENLQRATVSGANILESVDLGTRWMREKVAVVKAIVTKMLGIVKLTFSPF